MNKYYTINYYLNNIEVQIHSIPKNKYNKSKMYYDLIPYYYIDNTIIRHKNTIIKNEEELKLFFKSYIDTRKIYITIV